jgi:CheY-like chemotaxis protein
VRVLIVDDNATTRGILAETLRGWGMRPVTVIDAAAGLQAMTVALRGEAPFALVLIDAQMPGMDGFALAERIGQDEALAATPLVLMTSAGQRGDARAAAGSACAATSPNP